MKAMLKRNITYHISEDRPYRTFHILSTIGIGNIIKTVPNTDNSGPPSWKCLTDTGVILIMNKDKTCAITLYIASQALVSAMYEGKTPSWVFKMVRKNKPLAEIQNNIPLLKKMYGEL